MKRILTLVLTLVMVFAALSGCTALQNSSEEEEKQNSSETKDEQKEFLLPFDIETGNAEDGIKIRLEYESKPIVDLLNDSEWILDDVAKVTNDFVLTFDGINILYCSQTGTFSDEINQRYIILSNDDKVKVNNALQEAMRQPSYAGHEVSIEFFRYTWDGWGISHKTVKACNVGYRIIAALKNLKETGETVPKISDDVLQAGPGKYPAERGTMWIECENKIYRLSPNLSQICLVETHFGEGKLLEMSKDLKNDIYDAWSYVPYDYYKGTYNKGDKTVELKNVFKSGSSIKMRVKDIYVESNGDPKNKITIELISTVNQEVAVKLDCQQSDDNMAAGDSKRVQLKRGIPETVQLTFDGWPNANYWIYINVGLTKAEIMICP